MKNLLTILLAIVVLFTNCQEKMKEEKYIWSASLSAPKEYPVEIYEGALISDDYQFNFSHIWSIVKAGWGINAGTMAPGDNPISLPDTLEMTWYSIQEKKFYTGKWKLDKEHIKEIWKKGSLSTRTNKVEKFNEFLVGLAPDGFVNLWITGPIQVQVATFQAKDTILNKENTYPDFEFFFREDYRKAAEDPNTLFGQELYTTLKRNGWPNPEIYKEYNESYRWKFKTRGIPITDSSYFFYSCFNGNLDIFFNNETKNNYSPKPIPRHIYVIWKDKNDEEWIADLEFEYSTIKQAFDQFSQEEDLELLFKIDKEKYELDVFLQSAKKEIKVISNDRTLVKVDY